MTDPSGDPSRTSRPTQRRRARPGPPMPRRPGSRGAPGPAAASPTPVDLGRRRFFRQFAGELIHTAATVAGAAQALQQASAEAASVILNPEGAARLLGPAGDDASGTPGAGGAAGPSGFRTPFREDGGTLYLIDQRRLPDALVEYPIANGRRGGLRDPRDDRARRAGDRPGRGHRAGVERRDAGRRPALRTQGDPSRRRQCAHQFATDRGQPALGGRARHGPLHRGRRAVGGRRCHRRRRCAPRPMRSCSRPPPTTAGLPGSGWRSCRRPRTARSAS